MTNKNMSDLFIARSVVKIEGEKAIGISWSNGAKEVYSMHVLEDGVVHHGYYGNDYFAAIPRALYPVDDYESVKSRRMIRQYYEDNCGGIPNEFRAALTI